jgi:molybdate transport system regulatory protein
MMSRIGPLKLKAQLFCGEERALGPGRVDVLIAIEREGSITAAGRSLGMSYRYTWALVDSMNRCFRERLVEAAVGGRKGGGAVVTETGRAVIAAYRALEAELQECAQGGSLAALSALLREAPLSPEL